MNKKLIGFLGLLFLSLSFAPEDSIKHSGHYLRARFPIFNIECAEHPFTLHFVADITDLFAFSVVIGTEKTKNMTGSFFKDGYAPYDTFLTPIRLKKGDIHTFSFVILQKYLLPGQNRFSIFTHSKSFGMDVFTVPLYCDYPKTWRLPSKKPLGRDSSTGFVLKGLRCSDGYGIYEIRHQGFYASFTNPAHNIVPLEKMILTCSDIDTHLVPLTASSITLSIIDLFNNLTFFPKKYVYGMTIREVPLKLVGKGASRHLTLADTLAVSFDGREIRRSKSHRTNEYLTTHFFLPPVKNGKSLVYPATITFKNVGEDNFDSIVYQFNIYKNRNYFGSKGNSDYYVRETE